ncbi:hypothetical protein N7489_004632 [Penicillium chrysogenum]|uniref:uncharacterized protein n=1 Tax=Penicillium chrysogenum TaxID=5076 RepID=UPI0024DF1E72|nr:uncharacterized protein N7489_004632 [Penicillium chrysogenum]KAJ5244536.1 hypothetical protein N7489_004632 [Penicillium chrysogenum]
MAAPHINIDGSSAVGGGFLPPGTFHLISEDGSDLHGQRAVMLDPVPSNDPNEPLVSFVNWSVTRKAANFTIVLGMTIVVFTALSIQAIFWQQMVLSLHVAYTQLNQAMSVNFAGLATGCVLFIPLAKKYGRRPVYIVSTAIMLATSFWTSRLDSLAELYITNLLQGLAGATNEAIVEITISDLFFVHHRGSMNGLHMAMVMIGSFLTPMAAGAQATRQGWRWPYQTLGIFNAIFFLVFLFLYEETKYVPVLNGQPRAGQDTEGDLSVPADPIHKSAVKSDTKAALSVEPNSLNHELNFSIPMNTWRKRLALWSPSPEPIFPTVFFTGIQYASGVVWLTITANVMALVYPLPPYGFTPEQIGYMSLGPFIGNLIGAFYGGLLGDRSILYFSRRNKGFYEPEMRLYILHLPAIFMAGSLIMFGMTLSRVRLYGLRRLKGFEGLNA